MEKISLKRLHRHPCNIFVAPDLESAWAGSLRDGRDRRAFLIADAKLRSETSQLNQLLMHSGWRTSVLKIPANESSKQLAKATQLYSALLQGGADRSSVIFALGGGIIGDLAGFVAATFMRGVDWVVIPTTLLAQVDSSVGGKTAVNHKLGKNLIGAFHHPRVVICNTQYLKTLPEREIRSGLGEVIKLGISLDPQLLEFTLTHFENLLLKEAHVLSAIVAWCLKIKSSIVQKDEFEDHGIRQVLNFGHTAGHALEAATGYRRYRHGEAVLFGMRVACKLSEMRGDFAREHFQQVDSILECLAPRSFPKGISARTLVEAMKHDKKASHGKLRFILLSGLGKPFPDDGVGEKQVVSAIRWAMR